MGALEMRDWHERTEDPEELGDLRNIALAKQDRRGWIEAEREIGEGGFERVLSQALCIADCRQRMKVGDEVQRFALTLQLDELLQCAVVVAQVQPAGWLDARQDTRAT